MPAIFLTQTERIRYEQLPGLEPEDIRQGFYLTQADVQFVSVFHGSLNRVAVAIQLCLIRYLGFLPDNWKSHLPQEALSFIFSQLKLEGLPYSFLAEYGNRQPTKSFHHRQVLKFLHFKKWQPLDEPLLELWLIGQGMEHDNERWLLEKFCWKLHQDKILRPAIGTLERIIGGISERLHEETYKRLSFLWSDQLFEVLDTLLLPDAALKLTQHRWLCMPPTTGTYREINRALPKNYFFKGIGRSPLGLIGHPSQPKEETSKYCPKQLQRLLAKNRSIEALSATSLLFVGNPAGHYRCSTNHVHRFLGTCK